MMSVLLSPLGDNISAQIKRIWKYNILHAQIRDYEKNCRK